MSYLPSDDPKQFRRETLGLAALCAGFLVVLAAVVLLVGNVVIKLG